MTSTPYAGVDQPDVASMYLGGVFYRCYVMVNAETAAIDAVCVVEQENGQEVLLFRTELASTDDVDDLPDDPKIVASGSYFVVHFFTDDGATSDLHTFYLNMSTLQSSGGVWTYGGFVAAHQDRLMDMHPLGSSTNDYLLAYKDTVAGITIERRTAPVTTVWTQAISQTPIRVLGAYGNAADGVILVSYQRTATTQLWSTRANSSDGLGQVTAQTFTSLAAADFTQVGHARIDGSRTAVVCEARFSTHTFAAERIVAYRKLTNATAAGFQNEHWVRNLHLCSRPWSYANAKADGSEVDLYCCVGFKSLRDPGDWEQKSFFVVNLDHEFWSLGSGSSRLLPRPIVNLNLGTADSRPAGAHAVGGVGISGSQGKRINHLSHVTGAPPFGSDIKSRTFATVIWTRATVHAASDEAETEPTTSQVVGYKVHMEEPWVRHRDPSDPAAPSTNFKGAYPWGQFQTVEAGRGMFISGGTPSMYDGTQVAEIGFSWWPEIIGISTGAGGDLSDGPYQYTMVYEWTDALGQIHRSAPAKPRSVTVASPNDAVTLTVRCQTLTAKCGRRFPSSPQIRIAVYRTLANGSVFYRVASQGTLNDLEAVSVQYVDTEDDDTVGSSEPLQYQYDAEGLFWTPLEPFQPPALGPCANWQNRVWAPSLEDSRMLWYSKEILPDKGGIQYTAPEFNPTNVYRIDEGGDVTAMCSMDWALVVFKSDRIFLLQGDANTDAGTGSNLQHRRIALGTGCIEPRSVVLTPMGVFFQAAKGYYLVSREQSLEYIGADVEDILRRTGNVRSAHLLEDRHQIRVVCNEGVQVNYRVLIYDYLNKSWSYAPLSGVSASAWGSSLQAGTVWRGHSGETDHVVLAQTGLLLERANNSSAYLDSYVSGTLPVRVNIKTGWIKVAGILGFKRVRSILVQLNKPQASEVRAVVEYAVDGQYDAPLSDSFTWASPAPTVLRIRPSVQKMTAFRLTLFEPAGVPETENLAIAGIAFEVVAKQGHKRVPDTSVGT